MREPEHAILASYLSPHNYVAVFAGKRDKDKIFWSTELKGVGGTREAPVPGGGDEGEVGCRNKRREDPRAPIMQRSCWRTVRGRGQRLAHTVQERNSREHVDNKSRWEWILSLVIQCGERSRIRPLTSSLTAIVVQCSQLSYRPPSSSPCFSLDLIIALIVLQLKSDHVTLLPRPTGLHLSEDYQVFTMAPGQGPAFSFLTLSSLLSSGHISSLESLQYLQLATKLCTSQVLGLGCSSTMDTRLPLSFPWAQLKNPLAVRSPLAKLYQHPSPPALLYLHHSP